MSYNILKLEFKCMPSSLVSGENVGRGPEKKGKNLGVSMHMQILFIRINFVAMKRNSVTN